MPARHPRDGRGNSLSKRGGTRNRPAFQRDKPRLSALRTNGRNWETGCPRFTGRPSATGPTPALLAFLSGFPKTVQRVLFALAARLPSAANSTATSILPLTGPFRVVSCPLFHDQPEKARKWGRERLLLRDIPRQGLEFTPVPDYSPVANLHIRAVDSSRRPASCQSAIGVSPTPLGSCVVTGTTSRSPSPCS